MSARTCLLCGKALSRIWVGAGEDFCSREHRNQYRLRRGMDRLQEANKVASLMRRRENPKPIPTVHQPGNSDPHLSDSSHVRFGAHLASLAVRATRWSARVTLTNEAGWVTHYRKPLPDASPRAFGIPRHKTPRVILKDEERFIPPPGANLESLMQPCSLNGPPKSGQALRVSSSAGFRVPTVRPIALHPSVHQPVMRWPDRPFDGPLVALDRPSSQIVPAIPFTLPGLVTPSLPAPERIVTLSSRGPIAYGQQIIPSPLAPSVRGSGELWTNWEQAMPRPIPHSGQSMIASRFVCLPQESTAGSPAPQLVLVPIMPEDRAIGYIPAIAPSQSSLSGVPKASLEEQFDSGLGNWTGGTNDWILDPAGARTGSLALFTPTLEKRDYEMEFLVRIDHRSVTWLFRAANLTQYYQASISVRAEGGYEFRRGSFIHGTHELADPLPIQVPLNRKNAVTVRLRAVGSEFSVSLDGQAIETWTDSRLPSGGIGFVGAPDDRARIYWVRLSPLGSPVKEIGRR